jgi:DNA-directed RNA polymerase subunit RPC12/RpoP
VPEYECAVCGYRSSVRQEFVEFNDPVKLPKAVEKAKSKGRNVKPEDVRYLCLKCSQELYQEETRGPRPVRATCPVCGAVVEVWL